MAAPLQWATEREGLRIAKLFRKIRVGNEVRRCDLEALCAEDDLEIRDSRVVDPGYAGLLMRCADGTGGLIALRPGQDRGRRRFSIAHELGHYHIPKHRRIQGYCSEADMRARSKDAKRQEWEANDFATELLMPKKLFGEDARRLDVSVASAMKLADQSRYDVSVMAAAWRIVQLTREPVAIVVSREGRVEWVYKSDALRLPLADKGQRLHQDTLAAETFRAREGHAQPEAVDQGTWLNQERLVDGVLLESTHFIPSQDQVVSLLWLNGDGTPDE